MKQRQLEKKIDKNVGQILEGSHVFKHTQLKLC